MHAVARWAVGAAGREEMDIYRISLSCRTVHTYLYYIHLEGLQLPNVNPYVASIIAPLQPLSPFSLYPSPVQHRSAHPDSPCPRYTLSSDSGVQSSVKRQPSCRLAVHPMSQSKHEQDLPLQSKSRP